ncbi:uncharacterized protein MONBRDRAFT_36177 [Monosiga brevicollis MX1]|uniref:Integrator complex subunit 4 n=1 Tax=Monosiga brevicollis TaxID=81824 RepID=A9UTK2_MONBE|nr:uncharacterized protein MONBRDRAFT_36177 [Monosiga brevicollis MX1]EDQ91508.1 predicted protein [Monosiga brevicollis MX1]|eukprot:XP_001743930.1 hypothetical protein [Monosiga brevicollis MX1]
MAAAAGPPLKRVKHEPLAQDGTRSSISRPGTARLSSDSVPPSAQAAGLPAPTHSTAVAAESAGAKAHHTSENTQRRARLRSHLLQNHPWLDSTRLAPAACMRSRDPRLRRQSLLSQPVEQLQPQLLCVLARADPDARVRATALQRLHQALQASPEMLEASWPDCWDTVGAAIEDHHAAVRRSALDLLPCLADAQQASEGAGTKVNHRLEAFLRACRVARDPDRHLRQRAFSVVAHMRHVRVSWVRRCLDRQLISNLREKQSVLQRARTRHEAAEAGGSAGGDGDGQGPSSEALRRGRESDHGQAAALTTTAGALQQAPRKPGTSTNSARSTLDQQFDIGGCDGSFIQGLDDEDQHVRLACLAAIEAHSMRLPVLAQEALDCVITVVNDEIVSVRARALQVLAALGPNFVMHDEHVELLPAVCADAHIEVRCQVLALFKTCQLANVQLLQVAYNQLSSLLQRNSDSRSTILSAGHCLGRHHADWGEPLVRALFHWSEHFEPMEPDCGDARYALAVAIVCGALTQASSIRAHLPSFMDRHIRKLFLQNGQAFATTADNTMTLSAQQAGLPDLRSWCRCLHLLRRGCHVTARAFIANMLGHGLPRAGSFIAALWQWQGCLADVLQGELLASFAYSSESEPACAALRSAAMAVENRSVALPQSWQKPRIICLTNSVNVIFRNTTIGRRLARLWIKLITTPDGHQHRYLLSDMAAVTQDGLVEGAIDMSFAIRAKKLALKLSMQLTPSRVDAALLEPFMSHQFALSNLVHVTLKCR